MKLKGRKREVRSSPDDVAKLFSHTRLYLMRSPILHLVFEGSPLAWLLGHLAAMIAGYIRTRATAIKEILAQAIKARQVLSSFCIRVRSQLGPRSSEPAKEKTAGICTSEELLLVAGRPVSPAYSVIAATMSLR